MLECVRFPNQQLRYTGMSVDAFIKNRSNPAPESLDILLTREEVAKQLNVSCASVAALRPKTSLWPLCLCGKTLSAARWLIAKRA